MGSLTGVGQVFESASDAQIRASSEHQRVKIAQWCADQVIKRNYEARQGDLFPRSPSQLSIERLSRLAFTAAGA